FVAGVAALLRRGRALAQFYPGGTRAARVARRGVPAGEEAGRVAGPHAAAAHAFRAETHAPGRGAVRGHLRIIQGLGHDRARPAHGGPARTRTRQLAALLRHALADIAAAG